MAVRARPTWAARRSGARRRRSSQKGRPIAADALEAAEADIAFADGHFAVVGTNRSISLLDVAARAREAGTPLDTYHAWTREHMTFPNGTHVVEVEIDRDTGAVALVRADGGGRLRRAGQSDDRRRPGAWRDRAGRRPGAAGARGLRCATPARCWPARSWTTRCRAPTTCRRSDLEFNGTRCTTNPLGVKGCGEAGAVAMLPAIGNAILDALAPLGVTEFDGPATPFRVWQAMRD